MDESKVIKKRGPELERPFVLGYVERQPLEPRRGIYDEITEVWMINDGTTEAPLARSHADTLEESVTKTIENTDPPRRPRRNGEASRKIELDETVSSTSADPTDAPRPRRAGPYQAGISTNTGTVRPILDESMSKVTADPTEPGRPRRTAGRAGGPRPLPDETLTFTEESTDESRPRRSGF